MGQGVVPGDVRDDGADDGEVKNRAPAEQRGLLEAGDEAAGDDGQVEKGAEGEAVCRHGDHIVGLEEALTDDGEDAPAERGKDDEACAQQEEAIDRDGGEVEVREDDDDDAGEGQQDAQDSETRRGLSEEEDREEGDEQDIGLGEDRGDGGVGVHDTNVLEDVQEGDAGEAEHRQPDPFLARDPQIGPSDEEDQKHQRRRDDESRRA